MRIASARSLAFSVARKSFLFAFFSPTKKWISHNNSQKKWPRTQDLKPLYVANSAVFFAKKNVYVKNNNRVCNNPLPIISDTNKSFDIDDMDDFKKITKKRIISKSWTTSKNKWNLSKLMQECSDYMTIDGAVGLNDKNFSL